MDTTELTDLQHELLLLDTNVSGIGDIGRRASDEMTLLREIAYRSVQVIEMDKRHAIVVRSGPHQMSVQTAGRLRREWRALGVSNPIIILGPGMSVDSVLRIKEEDLAEAMSD